MEKKYVTDQEFEKEDDLEFGEYEGCVFRNCHFNDSDLSDYKFIDCEFVACDLSNSKILNTAFQDVTFKQCKLLGMHFEHSNAIGLSISFHDCMLNHSSFYQMKPAALHFMDCQMEGVDFTETVMKKSNITNCNLSDATFEYTNLESADLRYSINYQIDPEINRLKGAKFSLSTISGLLNKYGITIDKGS